MNMKNAVHERLHFDSRQLFRRLHEECCCEDIIIIAGYDENCALQ